MKIKAGIGYDIHRLKEGRKLFLGGLEIPFSKGLLGHSDGDCLIHAIIDSILGAMGERDIGQHFPDTDPKYKDIRSTELLERVITLFQERNAEIQNIDCIIIAEEPCLASYISLMKEIMCSIIQIEEECLGIKARTNEGIDLIGQGEAIASWALTLIKVG